MLELEMTVEQKKMLEIKQNINNCRFGEALLKIEEYISLPHTGIFEELLNIYIDFQIKLGLFDEAIKNVELLYKHFKKIDIYDLALKYAACCQTEKLRELLANYKFSYKKYLGIAKYCFTNGNIELAKELFELASNSKDEVIINEAQKKLDIIDIYNRYDNKVFQSQTYGCFKYHGNKLRPGHVIMTCRLRDDYSENHGYKKVDWPYMIWKVEDKKIYAFPVVAKVDRFNYVFSHEDYPCRSDRTLKDGMVCIYEDDVINVIDKITDDDCRKAIDLMQRSIIYSQKGDWNNHTNYFMNSFLEDKEVEVGDVLVFCDKEKETVNYYFVFGIDEYGYKIYEVSYRFFPFSDDVKMEYISKDKPLTSLIKLVDINRKKLLLEMVPTTNEKRRVLIP